MTEMQRWKVIDDDLMRPDEQPHGIVPGEVFLEVVLAADAEAAIAAVEKRARDDARLALGRHNERLYWAYRNGQDDMLKRCIAVILSMKDADKCEGDYCRTLDAVASGVRRALDKNP